MSQMQLREQELQSQIDIEKALSQKERELRKEYEEEIRKLDAENARVKFENEQLKALNHKEN